MSALTGDQLPEKWSEDLKDPDGTPISKTEYKKRIKAAQKEKEKAEKAAAKATATTDGEAKPKIGGMEDEKDIDPAAYRENRLSEMTALK